MVTPKQTSKADMLTQHVGLRACEAAGWSLADARRRLRDAVIAAGAAGVPEAAIARAAGISRSTVRSWRAEDTPS